MAKKNNAKINENYIHVCTKPKKPMNEHICSISDSCLTPEELTRITDFYVFHAPTLHSGNENKTFGLKWIGDFGWEGNGALGDLERKLLKSAKMHGLCFIKSEKN
ncbi:MAG: hypothetical protein LUC50_04630 [Ruminococcus sp.]|nr:hypothetical protein [Ruminococcus sp.]